MALLSLTTEWDVRTTGNDANGGAFDPGVSSPGTDYSQQDSAQIAYTDLVIGGTTTQLTSAGHPFTSAHVGNVINITGGTGFTVQRVCIVSVAANVATCHTSCGTAASTGGTGNLGGGMATLAATMTAMNNATGGGGVVNIKSGTYTQTAAVTQSTNSNFLTVIGYGSSHRDGGTKPLITTSTNSIHLFNMKSDCGFSNLSLSNTSGSPLSGIIITNGVSVVSVDNCIIDGFNRGIDCSNTGAAYGGTVTISNSVIKNCTGVAGIDATQAASAYNCYFKANLAGMQVTNGGYSLASAYNCVFESNTGGAFIATRGYMVVNCVFRNNSHAASNSGIHLSNSNSFGYIINSIFYNNSNTAIGVSGAPVGIRAGFIQNCAFGSNGTDISPTKCFYSQGQITLTASPFVSSSDYSLNNTAGGGALCSQLGYPTKLADGTSPTTPSVGATIPAGGGGGGGTVAASAFVA